MENVQDWAAYLMDNQNLFNNPNIPYSYFGFAQQALSYAYKAQAFLFSLLLKVSEKPDLASIALLLIILWVSVKLLGILVSTVLFWFRVARRIAFWGGLLGLGVWMYTRGPDGAYEDVNYWYETWNGQYERYEGQERLAKAMRDQFGGGGQQRGWGF